MRIFAKQSTKTIVTSTPDAECEFDFMELVLHGVVPHAANVLDVPVAKAQALFVSAASSYISDVDEATADVEYASQFSPADARALVTLAYTYQQTMLNMHEAEYRTSVVVINLNDGTCMTWLSMVG